MNAEIGMRMAEQLVLDYSWVKRPGVYGLKAELRTGFYTRQAFVVRPSGRIFRQGSLRLAGPPSRLGFFKGGNFARGKVDATVHPNKVNDMRKCQASKHRC